jgi:hypothetical protein
MSSQSHSFNAFETGLDGAIGIGDTTITLDDVSGLVAPGYLVIDPDDPVNREWIRFEGINVNDLTAVTRGLLGNPTQDVAHSSGARVRAVAVGQWLDDIFFDIDALETLSPLYLLLDGTRPMTGPLDMDGEEINGIGMNVAPLDADAVNFKYVNDTFIPLVGTNALVTKIPLGGDLEWGSDVNHIGFDGGGFFQIEQNSVLRLAITGTETFFRSPDGTTQYQITDAESEFFQSLVLPLTNSVYWGPLVPGNERIQFNASSEFIVWQAGLPRVSVGATETWFRTPDTITALTLDNAEARFLSPQVLFETGNTLAPGIAFNAFDTRGITASGATMDLIVDTITMISMSNIWVRMPTVFADASGSSVNVEVISGGQLVRVPSSRRYKENIAYDIPGLADVELRPARFNRIGNEAGERIGFIAEDVADQDPRAVVFDDDGEVDRFDTVAVLAILAAKVNRLENA